MSVTHIKFVPKQEVLQITMRLFIDDLQFELNTLNKTTIELATDREPKKIDSIYMNYLSNNFSVEVNKLPKNLTFIGKEYDSDMAVFYLEIPKIKEIKNIRIENNILNKSFTDQKNIVKFNINQKQKSFILIKDKLIALINY